jgi:hypothetical protein
MSKLRGMPSMCDIGSGGLKRAKESDKITVHAAIARSELERQHSLIDDDRSEQTIQAQSFSVPANYHASY